MMFLEILFLLGQIMVSHASDHCDSLEGVLANYPQCTAIDCIGLTCTPPAPFENFTASFTVIECTDPVQVNFTISSSSGAMFTSLFDCSQVVQFGGDTSVNVQMSRNATHLDFQATIFHTATDSVTLFPDSLISLNPADCMCSSLQALAQKLESIHPIVESDCVTTRNCTGVRCELNISADFTAMYFDEVVVLPCLNALEFLVENLQSEALILDRFQGPINENSTIDIGGFAFIAGQQITVQDYSMTANSFLYGDGIGTIMVIPQQTIILDRTQCNVPEFPTVPMPTRLLPPQPVAPDASSVCVSLHKLAQDIYITSPVFRCELNDACESGLTCVLNVVFTEYKVDIKITENSVIFSIFSIDGKTSYGEFKDNTTVRLPEPRGAYLDFKQNVDGQKVGFMLQLRFSFLTTGQQTEELIPFTVIAFPPPQTMNTTNITVVVVTVVIAILLIIITVCVILLIAVLCLCKQKKSLSQGEPAFDFRKMSDSKEGSRSLKTAVDGTLTTQGKGTKDGQEVDEEIKVDL